MRGKQLDKGWVGGKTYLQLAIATVYADASCLYDASGPVTCCAGEGRREAAAAAGLATEGGVRGRGG